VYLLGDPNALYDALVNLVRNAADASTSRATVRVALERAGSSLRLTVTDTGAGMSAHVLERIFDPGFTTKQFGEGTGMGLAMVQDVVRNMFGGSIAVDSMVGAGTTATLTLPIPPQRALDPPVTQAAAAR
jgi:signal transduction histidine kinase